VSLNLSWNGVDGRACAKLAAALTVNSCLTSLDLSRTSIDSRSVKLLVGALRLNGTLTTLKVGVREYDNDSMGVDKLLRFLRFYVIRFL